MALKCIDFLTRKRRGEPANLVVVHGDDEFLARMTLRTLRDWVVGPEPDDFTFVSFTADAALSDVLDALDTAPMLGDRRLVVLEQADKFVTAHRDALLRYASAPSRFSVLALTVTRWPANTKLAKCVAESGLTIDASAPKPWHVPDWCVKWAPSRHGKKIDRAAASWLVELVGTNLGQLDSELAKLAGEAAEREMITIELINRLVAGTRTETAFKLLDMALDGEVARALGYLDRQLVAGDAPVMILAMLVSQLRKLAQASRRATAGTPTPAALTDAGIPPFAIQKAQEQLRHLGQARLAGLYRLLLRADLALKGGSGLEPRQVLERVLIHLADRTGRKTRL